MADVGLPVTIIDPRITPADQPSWGTTLAPDTQQVWLFTEAQANQVLITPAAGRRFLLTGIVVSHDGDSGGYFLFDDDNDQGILGPLWFAAQMPDARPIPFINGLILGVNRAIRVTTTFTTDHSVQLTWKEF